jgi:hypothetical protein
MFPFLYGVMVTKLLLVFKSPLHLRSRSSLPSLKLVQCLSTANIDRRMIKFVYTSFTSLLRKLNQRIFNAKRKKSSECFAFKFSKASLLSCELLSLLLSHAFTRISSMDATKKFRSNIYSFHFVRILLGLHNVCVSFVKIFVSFFSSFSSPFLRGEINFLIKQFFFFSF